jgi:O-antigen/teichoic acid export membrane protein
MPPDEFGAASLLSAASLVVTAIIATPLIQLIVRAAARGEDNGPRLLRLIGTYCYLVLPIGIGVIAAVFALFVPKFLGVAGYIWGIELLAIAFQPASSTFAMWVAQAREDLRRFVWLSATSVFVAAASKILLVVVMRLGVLGWVVTDLLTAVFSAVLAIALVRLPRVHVTSEDLRYAVRFTLPLVPHTASLWALTALSRPAMAAVSTLEQVGLLSFGLNLATAAGLVLMESNRAVLPRYSREVFPAPTQETLTPVRWQIIAAFVVPAAVGCGVAIAGQWIFAAAYWPSFALTGILLIGQAAYGLYLIPMNYLTQAAALPRYSAVASGSGAAVILVSILLLGRTYGAVGVACATAVGYMTMAAVVLAVTRAVKLDIAWRTWLAFWPEILLAFSALACSVAALASPMNSPLSWTLSGISVAFLIAAALRTMYRDRST